MKNQTAKERWKEITERAKNNETVDKALKDFDATDKRLESANGADEAAYPAPYSNPRGRGPKSAWR